MDGVAEPEQVVVVVAAGLTLVFAPLTTHLYQRA
jgi:hypothetical protein